MPVSAPKKIEIFRPGTFTTRSGDEITFTAADLAAVATAYEPAVHEAPLVAGHPKHDDPAQGWVVGLEFTDGRLLAEVDQVNPAFSAAVGKGEYKHVSAAFYPPASKANPKPGGYYLRHVGCLGAMPPAVSGLKPLSFAAGDDDFVEFGQGDLPLGSVLRTLREFFIAKFGLADADQALPSYIVSWAEDDDREPDSDHIAPPLSQAAFSQDPKGTVMADKATDQDVEARLRDVEAREVKFKEREVAFSQQERALARRDNETFLDGLVKLGKFLPAQKDNTLAFMESLAGHDHVIEFAEGDGNKTRIKPLDAYKRQLAASPKMVEFGEVAPGDGASTASIEFSAPPGAIVDPERLRLHGQALQYQRQHPDTSYINAVKAVSKE